jgi:hypothetical protein
MQKTARGATGKCSARKKLTSIIDVAVTFPAFEALPFTTG